MLLVRVFLQLQSPGEGLPPQDAPHLVDVGQGVVVFVVVVVKGPLGGHGVDGQHDPAFLCTMAEYLEKEDLDMVIGSRFIEKKGFQSSSLRRLGIRYFSILIRVLTGTRITDPTSGLRMINRRVMREFAYNYPKDYPEPESVVAILCRNCKVREIPVVMRERMGGVSSISMKKSVYYMIKVTLAILFEKIRGGKR